MNQYATPFRRWTVDTAFFAIVWFGLPPYDRWAHNALMCASGSLGSALAYFLPTRWQWARSLQRRTRLPNWLFTIAVFVATYTLHGVASQALHSDAAREALLFILRTVAWAMCAAVFNRDGDDDFDAASDASEAVKRLAARVRAVHGPNAVPERGAALGLGE